MIRFSRHLTLALFSFALFAPQVVVAESTVAQRLNEAKTMVLERNYRAATIRYKNVLQREPSNLQARLGLANVYLALGLGAEADKELALAQRVGATPAMLLPMQAQAHMLLRNYSAVLGLDADSASLDDEAKAKVLAYKAQALLFTGKKAESNSALTNAKLLAPSSRVVRFSEAKMARLNGRSDAAMRIADSLLIDNPSDHAVLEFKAQIQVMLGDIDSSKADYQRLIALAPWSVTAQADYITVLVGSGDLDAAEKQFDAAQSVLKGTGHRDFLSGMLSFHRGDTAKAQTFIERTLSKYPNHPASNLYMASIRYSAGQFKTAEDHLLTYLEQRPEDPSAVRLMVATMLRMNKPALAKKWLMPLLEKDSKNPHLLALLGSAEIQGGKTNEGLALLNQAVALAPDEGALHTQLAIGQLFGGDSTSAESGLRKALDLGSDLIQTDIMLVMLALKRGASKEAIAAAKDMVRRRPDSALAQNLLGAGHMLAKDYDNARAAYRQSLKIDPNFHTAELNLARIDLAENALPAAETRLRGLLKKASKEPGVYHALAEVAKRKNNQADIIRWLERAVAENPDDLRASLGLLDKYLAKNDQLKAMRISRQMLNNHPSHPVAVRAMGLVQLRAGDQTGAIQQFERLTALSPKSANAWYLLGTTERDNGNSDRALPHLEQAWALDQSQLNVGIALANLYNERKRHADAMSIAKLLQGRKDVAWAGYRLASSTLSRSGDEKGALKALEKAVELRPTSLLVVQYANILQDQGMDRDAQKTLQAWLQKEPDDLQALMGLAKMLHRNGDKIEAIKVYEKALQVDGRQVVALNNLAWLYHDVGDKKAIPTARRALSLAPDRGEIADTLGWILALDKQYDEALVYLREADAKLSGNGEIQYHLGVALAGLGRKAEAITALQKAVLSEFADVAKARALLKELRG